MSNKMKILLSILVPVVVLAVAGGSLVMATDGAVTPQAATADNVTGIKGLLPRVAAILGIPEQKLVEAIKEAEKQLRDEAFFKALDKAVENGRLTREEADKLKAWWQQRPDFIDRGGNAAIGRILGKNRGLGNLDIVPPKIGADNIGGNQALLSRVASILGIPVETLKNAIMQAQQEIQNEAFLRMLEKAVEKGIITQAEADQIKQWWQARPEAADRLLQQILKRAPQPRGPKIMPAVPRGQISGLDGSKGANGRALGVAW